MGKGRLRVQVSVNTAFLCATLIKRAFRPERWENPPASISSIPGVWGHMLTFLGGPRACIGYRFSLVEYVLTIHLFTYLLDLPTDASPSSFL